MSESIFRNMEQSQIRTEHEGLSAGLDDVRNAAYKRSSSETGRHLTVTRYDRNGQIVGKPAGREMPPQITFYDHEGHVLLAPTKH